MQAIAIEGKVFFIIMFGVLGLAVVNGILWLIMHNILYKKLDSVLFVKPYFSQFELEAYSSWPLSLIKTMLYMFLISAPTFSRNRRFKGFTQKISVGKPLEIASLICISLLFLTVLCGLAFFGYGSFLYIVNTVSK